MLRLRTVCVCARRTLSTPSTSPEVKVVNPFILKPRRKRPGPLNPLLELSKPKAFREPFIKGIIVPEFFDNRLLTYPEVLDASRVNSIEQRYDELKRYVDSLDRDVLKREFTADIRQRLASFGAFGALIPTEFGGQGWTHTEFARFMEAFGGNLALASIVFAHNCTADALLLRYGSDECKAKFLRRLASGELIAAYAFAEPDTGVELEACKCCGKHYLSDEHLTVTGQKAFVTNGQFADVFVTLCKILRFSVEIDNENSPLSLVVVERESPGVSVNQSATLKGLQGNGMASVSFDKVVVPSSHVLNTATNIAKAVIDFHSRLRSAMSAAVVGAARGAFDQLLADAQHAIRDSKPLSEDTDVGEKLAEAAAMIYAIEGAVYMTAAINDAVHEPNTALEDAATMLLSLESTLDLADYCVQFYGSKAFEKGHFALTLQHDLNCLQSFCNCVNLSRLFLSMMGLQFAGGAINQRIKILRDPLTYLGDYFKILFQILKSERREVRMKKPSALEHAVHESLAAEANLVAYYHRELGEVTEDLLSAHGAQVFDNQVAMAKFSSMILEVFAVTVALARLSRCRTQGIEHGELETLLFDTLSSRTLRHLTELTSQNLYLEASITRAENDIIEKMINDAKYSLEHPLLKNF